MAEAARVVRLSGYGQTQLRDAIQSGMLSADAERAYRKVLEDNKRLRSENRDLRMRLNVVYHSRAEERRCKIEAYRMVLAKDAEHQRAQDWRVSVRVALMAVGGLAAALATVITVITA